MTLQTANYEELTEQEYHGLYPLIDRRIVTMVYLERHEMETLFKDNERYLQMIRGKGSVQLYSAKVQLNIGQITKVETLRFEDEFPSWVWDRFKVHQGINLSLHHLKTKLGMRWIIKQLAIQISEQFEMTYNQADAVINKLLGNSMDSTARTHLYQIRQKVMKYKPLVDNFATLLLTPEEQNRDSLRQFSPDGGSFVSDISRHRYSLVPPSEPPVDRHTTSNPVENGLIRLKEIDGKKQMVLPFSRLEYRCTVCERTESLEITTVESEEIEKRFHHDREMVMILRED